MKFLGNHAEMLPLAKMLAAVASPHARDFRHSCVLMEAQKNTVVFTAQNTDVCLQLQCPASVQEAGACLLPAGSWCAILGHCSPEIQTVSVAANRNIVQVSNGHTQYEFAALDEEGYPRPTLTGKPESLTELGKQIPLVADTTFCAAPRSDPKRLAMQCVHLTLSGTEFRAECTDGNRAAWQAHAVEGVGAFDVLIPADSFDRLAAIIGQKDSCKLGKCGEYLLALRPNMVFAARCTDLSFPNFGAAVQQFSASHRAVMPADLFLLAVRSAMTSAGADVLMRLILRTQELCVMCSGGQTDTASAESCITVPAEVETPTPANGFLYKPQHVLAAARTLGKGELTVAFERTGTLHLHTERADHLLFPCRERARTGTKTKKKKAA